MPQPLSVKPGARVHLKDFDPRYAEKGIDKEEARREVADNVAKLRDLAYALYAENRRAVLVVLQGMDTSGKDGVIRAAMHGVSPQSCQVTAFKVPSEEELDHDFLWRVHGRVPRRGHIGIFNRSHYEDVLVVRVKQFVPPEVWQSRYETINTFEKLLSQYITLVKVFLHISPDEQRQRLQERLDDPSKNWKFRRGDLDDRKLWSEYQAAYEDALSRCNTEHAPWHIVPADRKWYRDLVVTRLLRHTLEQMDPQYPPPEAGLEGLVVD